MVVNPADSSTALGIGIYGDCWRIWTWRLRLWRRKRRDQEDAIVPTSSSHGETEDVLEGCASSITVSPNFLTPMQSHSPCSVHSGAEAATTSAASDPSSSSFLSARIQSLRERRNDLGSELEFEIESSKSHWTETSVATSDFDDEVERVPDSVMFEKLKEHAEWGPFFRRQPYELEIGEKIAEGGQAEIFEALGRNEHDYKPSLENKQEKRRLVVKVFKKGYFLEDLQRWWPPGLASAALPYRYFNRSSSGQSGDPYHGLCWSVGAQLLDDGRFAFIFDRFWGDFRKLIDQRMLKRNGALPFSLKETHSILSNIAKGMLMLKRNGAAPFSVKETHSILSNIAKGMLMLHKSGLLHRDLKAANVLLAVHDSIGPSYGYGVYIADFESAVGSSGTDFWRAPEVLLALKNRSLMPETFTQQSDVYSYAMTCYEVLTGRIPFEGHPTNDYDIVLRGERPLLPDDIDPFFTSLVRKCWHADPLQRPSFHEIVAGFKRLESQIQAELEARRNRRPLSQWALY